MPGRTKHAAKAAVFVLLILAFVMLWFGWENGRREEQYIGVICETLCVPNIVHFIIFGKTELDFISFLSIISVLKVQKPEQVIVHIDSAHLEGRYWSALQLMIPVNTSLQLSHLDRPTHVFGQRLSSVYHASDIARIQVLMQYGGIYLDTDMLVLRPLDRFRKFRMVVGWPHGEYIGTQILIAHKDAKFLSKWLESYKEYHPREWYYNAGKVPTEQILQKHPELVHHEPFYFGVSNMAVNLYNPSSWQQWRVMYTIHLLSRHPPAPPNMDEKFIRTYRSPFGEISRWLLYKLKPRIIISKLNSSLPIVVESNFSFSSLNNNKSGN